MSKKIWIIGVLIVMLALIVTAVVLVSPAAEEHPATVIETIGQVDAHPRPNDDWQPAAVGLAVHSGGQVRTGAESFARLELLEGVVRLSAETVFTVEKSTTRRGNLLTTLVLEAGRLWINLTTDQPHEFAVHTGAAVAAVRDTHFCVAVSDGTILVSVAEGAVELTAQEQTVTVSAGQQSTVVDGQPPAPSQPMSDDERTLWATEGDMPHMAPPKPTPTPEPVADAFADQVIDYQQGSPGWADYVDPSAALGAPDWAAEPELSGLVNLGIGGHITLAFSNNLAVDGPGPDIRLFGGPDNDESVIVEVSVDGLTFQSLGNSGEPGSLNLSDAGLRYVKFIRITDDGSTEQAETGSAGAGLDAVQAVYSIAPGELPRVRDVTWDSADVWCRLFGPAGAASRSAETVFDANVRAGLRMQVVVQTPAGQTITLPRYADLFEWDQRFSSYIQAMPPAGGVYTFTLLDADGVPVPGMTASDVYVGGSVPDPPSNVRAEVIAAGVQLTWTPSPVIPGTFEPSASPPLGFYQIALTRDEGLTVYGWNNTEFALAEPSHLVPLRRRDFGPGDRGMALGELPNGTYHLYLNAFSVAPAGSAGLALECEVNDPGEELLLVITNGQVQVEQP